MSESMRPLGDWGQIGSTHNNGDRFVGYYPDKHAHQLYADGTPPANIIVRSSVTAAIEDVRVGDALGVTFDGSKHWWASHNGNVIGRLSWSLKDEVRTTGVGMPATYPREGTLEVQRILINRSGSVVNCAGIVIPAAPAH